jgi:Bacterial Ig domain
MKKVLLSAAAASAFFVTVAPVEAACNIPNWQFRWGPSPSPVAINITEGSTCGSNVRLTGAQKLTGIALTSRPSNGTARTTSSRFEYVPRAGFKGTDSFSVELRGTDQWNQPITNTLNVSVNVQ